MQRGYNIRPANSNMCPDLALKLLFFLLQLRLVSLTRRFAFPREALFYFSLHLLAG